MKKFNSVSEKIRFAAACEDIENMMARHCYHHVQASHRDEMRELWHSDSSKWEWGDMDDIMLRYAEDTEVRTRNELSVRLRTPGNMVRALRAFDYQNLSEISMHAISVPMLNLTEDGLGCRAFWFTPGYVTPSLPEVDPESPNGEVDPALWMWERYNVDWLLDEDGHYKITRMANMPDGEGEFDMSSWTDQPSRDLPLVRGRGISIMPVLPLPRYRTYEDIPSYLSEEV